MHLDDGCRVICQNPRAPQVVCAQVLAQPGQLSAKASVQHQCTLALGLEVGCHRVCRHAARLFEATADPHDLLLLGARQHEQQAGLQRGTETVWPSGACLALLCWPEQPAGASDDQHSTLCRHTHVQRSRDCLPDLGPLSRAFGCASPPWPPQSLWPSRRAFRYAHMPACLQDWSSMPHLLAMLRPQMRDPHPAWQRA